MQEGLRQLDQLVGLRQVKQELRHLTDLARFQNQRRQAGLPHDPPKFQLAFVGPPGTGKSTVARLLSDILWAAGVLKHGRLVELNALLDLPSQPASEAERRMTLKLAAAIGGTLLIDHASALLASREPGCTAAMRLLLQTMVKYRGQLVVILADHSDGLRQVLARHPVQPAPFPQCLPFLDYNASELGQIFQQLCDRHRYQVTRWPKSSCCWDFAGVWTKAASGSATAIWSGRCLKTLCIAWHNALPASPRCRRPC